MSKTKTKRARREQKREGHRKAAARHRKAEKATAAAAPSNPSKPMRASTTHALSPKKQKTAQQMAHKPPVPQASQKHAVPFGAYDHILLVGEGDFSFTRSLAIDHGCANVTGTSYDAEEQVYEKYPAFSGIQGEVAGLTPPVPLHHGIDATKISSYKALRCVRSDDGDDDDDEEDTDTGKEGWDTIVFMFPHTGGLSTDVNRQVRSNQALLVSFFKSCLDASSPAQRIQILRSQAKKPTAAPVPPFLRIGGKIIVTLFEGDPYSLWNIRDLARHSGLKVVESWKFDWGQYPSYRHVRTLGMIEGGGAWKGEDREARMYVFEKIPLVADSDEEREIGRLDGRGKGVGVRREKKTQEVVGKKRGRVESSDDGSD